MTSNPRMAILIAATIFLAAPATAPAQAQAFSSDQRHEIESIVKGYLLEHPEVLQDIMAELDKRQQAAEVEKHRAAVAEYNATLFRSPHQVVLGNPQGNVTMVEFFDYNCGFCKRAMSDMLDLLKTNPNLKFVLKEFPVLGEGSVEAAHVAVAARMQDVNRQEVHRVSPEAAGRPRPGRQGARARGRQRGRVRHGSNREGHGQRRGEEDDR